jgi:nicotinamidase-related amidase
MSRFRLSREGAVIVVVDVQERMAAAMNRREQVVKGITALLKLAEVSSIPVIVTEQYPKGLGPTLPEIVALTPELPRLEKISFSCCGADGFLERLRELGRRQVVLTGMETHVCVLQTALDLIDQGFEVFLPWDALCSRSDENHRVGLEFVRQAGGMVTSVETAVFQVLGKAGTPEFKTVQAYIK